MKYSVLFFLIMLATGCQSQSKNLPSQQTSAPAATSATLKDLHWQLRDVLRMQLPATFPDDRNGASFKKSYSLDFQWQEANKNYLIELPEKLLDAGSEQVSSGSKYYIPFENLDVKAVRIVFSADQKQTAILLPAKEGKAFTYHPFSNDPDTQVNSVIIGWYDRVQDRTLGRALVLWQQFLMKMGEEKPQ